MTLKHRAQGAMAVTLFSGLAGVAAASAAFATPTIVPHHAIYSVSLPSVDPGASVQGVSGSYDHRLEHTCDGWVTEERLVLTYQMANGAAFEQITTASSFESLDGTLYRFVSRSATGDHVDTFAGKAAVEAVGTAGVARYTLPGVAEFDLPEGTRFPIGYTTWAIDAAAAGKRMVAAPLFDGSEGRGAQHQVVFFGRERGAAVTMGQDFGEIGDRRAWPMRLAIYGAENTDGTPELEMEVLQLDNGVMGDIKLVYPEMTLALKLNTLQAKAKNPC